MRKPHGGAGFGL